MLGVVAIAVTSTGCAVSELVEGEPASAATGLVPFSSCSDLVDYLRASAAARTDVPEGDLQTPVGIEPVEPFDGVLPPAEEPAAPAEAPAAEAAPPAEPGLPAGDGFDAASGEGSVSSDPGRSATPPDGFSVTNVQETGVDEPDIVKTDGSRLFAIANGMVQELDLTGPAPRLVGTQPVRGIADPTLLLAGDRLVVMGSSGAVPFAEDLRDYGGGLDTVVARMLVLDVSDPGSMRPLGAVSVEGTPVSARMTGTSVRIVVSSQPHLLPAVGSGGDWLDEWVIGSGSGADPDSLYQRWMPRLAIEDAQGAAASGPIVSCGELSRPDVFSGYGITSVLTLDLASGIVPVDRDAVLGDAATVYASPTSLYVATLPFSQEIALDGRTATSIHRFDIADPQQSEYRGSGGVSGYLLNQWAMSEKDGVLRVATTGEPPWWDGDGTSESGITTLTADGDGLGPLGRIGGLGKGERIFGVRFVGNVGYVVTFRQTDPLYTVDLSDPSRPKLLGELKIPGYSAYLHPLEEGLLLGIGQDATETGQVLGTQLSLFDVSDLANPVRLHKRTLEGAQSEVETDHHAFLWWAQRKLGVMPIEGPVPAGDLTGDGWFSGAVGFTAERASGIAPRGVVVHPDEARIRRALVVGGQLLTVSEAGVEANDLDTFQQLSFTSFLGAA